MNSSYNKFTTNKTTEFWIPPQVKSSKVQIFAKFLKSGLIRESRTFLELPEYQRFCTAVIGGPSIIFSVLKYALSPSTEGLFRNGKNDSHLHGTEPGAFRYYQGRYAKFG